MHRPPHDLLNAAQSSSVLLSSIRDRLGVPKCDKFGDIVKMPDRSLDRREDHFPRNLAGEFCHCEG